MLCKGCGGIYVFVLFKSLCFSSVAVNPRRRWRVRFIEDSFNPPGRKTRRFMNKNVIFQAIIRRLLTTASFVIEWKCKNWLHLQPSTSSNSIFKFSFRVRVGIQNIRPTFFALFWGSLNDFHFLSSLLSIELQLWGVNAPTASFRSYLHVFVRQKIEKLMISISVACFDPSHHSHFDAFSLFSDHWKQRWKNFNLFSTPGRLSFNKEKKDEMKNHQNKAHVWGA